MISYVSVEDITADMCVSFHVRTGRLMEHSVSVTVTTVLDSVAVSTLEEASGALQNTVLTACSSSHPDRKSRLEKAEQMCFPSKTKLPFDDNMSATALF